MNPPSQIVLAAVDAARMSPCMKSKRGVVLFRSGDGAIVARGFNGPPADLPCRGTDECRGNCSAYCIHAEMRALMTAHPFERFGVDALHVKVDGVTGELVAGGGPSCLTCASAVLDAALDGFWLYEAAAGPAWVRYSATDFYHTTVEALEFWR